MCFLGIRDFFMSEICAIWFGILDSYFNTQCTKTCSMFSSIPLFLPLFLYFLPYYAPINSAYMAFKEVLPVPLSLLTKHLIIFNTFMHLSTIFWICASHVILSSHYNPENLNCFTLSYSYPYSLSLISSLILFLVKNIILVLSTEYLNPPIMLSLFHFCSP